jgi:hypothetical protein
MKKLLLFLMLFYFSATVVAQQNDVAVIREFMATIIPKNDSWFTMVETSSSISENNINLFKKASLTDSALSPNQIDQICSSSKLYSNFTWTNDILDSVDIISKTLYDSLVLQNTPLKLYKYSKPLFTQDYKYCLFLINWECGPLCGGFRLDLYQKNRGTWVRKKNYIYSSE